MLKARADFEDCARNFEKEARDLRNAEIAQAVAHKDSQLLQAEGNMSAMRGQLQQAIDGKSSADIRLKEAESGYAELQSEAHRHSDQLAAQLQEAAGRIWSMETKQHAMHAGGRALEEDLQLKNLQLAQAHISTQQAAEASERLANSEHHQQKAAQEFAVKELYEKAWHQQQK